MQTYVNPFKQNNDHTRIMRKVRFRSSFSEWNLNQMICFFYKNVFVMRNKKSLRNNQKRKNAEDENQKRN